VLAVASGGQAGWALCSLAALWGVGVRLALRFCLAPSSGGQTGLVLLPRWPASRFGLTIELKLLASIYVPFRTFPLGARQYTCISVPVSPTVRSGVRPRRLLRRNGFNPLTCRTCLRLVLPLRSYRHHQRCGELPIPMHELPFCTTRSGAPSLLIQ
jgi:hypothetical protein